MQLPRRIAALFNWRVGSLVLATAACEDDSTFLLDIDAGVVHTRFANVCTAYARALCNHAYSCSSGEPPPEWASQGQCVERETLQCELTSSDPNVHFDGDAVARCATESVSCSSTFPPLEFCLLPGETPTGGTCLWSAACASQLCVRFHFDRSMQASDPCGVCIDCGGQGGCPGGACIGRVDGAAGCEPYAALGESCDAGSLGCAPGTWCDQSLHCSPRPQLEQACGHGVNDPRCVLGTYCTLDGNCVPLARLGEACGDGTTGPPCALANTNEAAYCDDTQHCAPVTAAPYGGSCGTVIPCSGGGLCVPNGYAYPGTCTPPVPDGLGPCGNDNGLPPGIPCLTPALCVNSRCVYPTLASCGG